MAMRGAMLAIGCLVLLGGAWLMSSMVSSKGEAQGSAAPDKATAVQPQPNIVKVEPSKSPKDSKDPAVAQTEANKAPQESKPAPKLIEVDLSKLPPDLVKELQGAIVDKPRSAKGEQKAPPEK
jgi:hypothetical protein